MSKTCHSESRVLSMIFLAPTGALGEKISDLYVSELLCIVSFLEVSIGS